MNLEICSHKCPKCGCSYDSIETSCYDTSYVLICKKCLEEKIIDLEDKISKLFNFFTTTSNLRVK